MNDLLKGILPLLGSALGPAGSALGSVAASFIASKLELPSNTVEAVQEVLNSGKLSSDDITKLKLAELDFKKWMDDNNIKREQLSVQNTQGARDMQVATKSWVPSALALIITVGYLGILVGLMKGVLTVADNQVLLILIGALATGFGTVLNFFLGSSHGSQSKDSMLMNSTPAK